MRCLGDDCTMSVVEMNQLILLEGVGNLVEVLVLDSIGKGVRIVPKRNTLT